MCIDVCFDMISSKIVLYLLFPNYYYTSTVSNNFKLKNIFNYTITYITEYLVKFCGII